MSESNILSEMVPALYIHTRNSFDIHKWNLCDFWLDLDNKRKTRNIPKQDKISTEKIFPKNDTFQLLIITLLN